MTSLSRGEYKQLWDDAGWCVIEGVIPPDDLADAQRVLLICSRPRTSLPTTSTLSATPRSSPNEARRGSSSRSNSGALNRVALHDAMLDIAECLLETRDIRLYQAAVIAKYSNAAPDYEQLLHVDYANHTLVVPRTDVGYQHLETFVYLTDVTPSTGATRVVSREHTTGIPIERTYLHLEEYADLYVLEEPASGPAGSVFVYRPDVFHRGVPLSTPRAARFLLPVAFKPAGTDWIGYHAFPARAEDMAWHRFMHHATLRQLSALGFPKPGDPYWTAETLAGVAGGPIPRHDPLAGRGLNVVRREVRSPIAEPEPVSVVGRETLPALPPPPASGLGVFEVADHLGFRVLDDRLGVGEDPLDIIGRRVGFVFHRRAIERRCDERPVDHRQLEVRAVLGAPPGLLRREAEHAVPSDFTVVVGASLEMAAVLADRHVPSIAE